MNRKTLDITGQKFNMLQVLTYAGSKGRGAIWYCRCDCGNELKVRGNSLRSGTTKSCGCLLGNPLPAGESAFNTLLRDYKRRACERGYTFELTDEQFRCFTKQHCHYCGVPPTQTIKCNTSEYTYNGVDRVDSTKSYTINNCVPCCGVCNTMKMDMDYNTFIQQCKRILENLSE